jgi:hypothetical protein
VQIRTGEYPIKADIKRPESDFFFIFHSLSDFFDFFGKLLKLHQNGRLLEEIVSI